MVSPPLRIVIPKWWEKWWYCIEYVLNCATFFFNCVEPLLIIRATFLLGVSPLPIACYNPEIVRMNYAELCNNFFQMCVSLPMDLVTFLQRVTLPLRIVISKCWEWIFLDLCWILQQFFSIVPISYDVYVLWLRPILKKTSGNSCNGTWRPISNPLLNEYKYFASEMMQNRRDEDEIRARIETAKKSL